MKGGISVDQTRFLVLEIVFSVISILRSIYWSTIRGSNIKVAKYEDAIGVKVILGLYFALLLAYQVLIGILNKKHNIPNVN